jgi:formylglycine-generating enzyme required for sulfatase activity
MGNTHGTSDVYIALRGGSWSYTRRSARVSNRFSYVLDSFDNGLGFRVVVAPI